MFAQRCRRLAWSFVNCKGHKQWIWLAIELNTREIVGIYIGNRSRESALKLWHSLPPVYPRVFGGKFPPETLDGNVQSAIQIFGMLIKALSQSGVTKLLVKIAVKLIILKDSTTL